jgi:hypothetical protein
MRNRELHDALRDFALESAALLSAAVQAGAELPYDVLEEPGTGSVLYRYRPLTAEFIGARWDSVGALHTFEPAAAALGTGAEAYLRVRGLPGGADAEPALRAMLERLYEDASGFEFPEERFETVYAEVERTLYENTMRAAVVVAVHGLVLEDDRVDLGPGLLLARGDTVAAPPEAVWPLGPAERERATGPNTVAVLERDVETGTALPATEARIRFRRLLTAMRLLKPGRAAFNALGWGRADEGAWQPVGLSFGGPGRGEPWTLPAAEAGELAELVELVAAARLPGRVAWALGRFEMGCDRASEMEALPDYLLALRALLDADDETGRASLGLRLAALCAEESQRRAVRARLEAAFAIERRAMSGAVVESDPEAEEDDDAALVRELEQHVRALLRDVVCGYLAADLRSVADDILLASGDPIEIRARDIRHEPEPELGDPPPDPATRAPDPDPRAACRQPGLFARTDARDAAEHETDETDESEPDRRVVRRAGVPTAGPGTAADPRSSAWAVASLPGPRTKRAPVAVPDPEPVAVAHPEPVALPDPEPVATDAEPTRPIAAEPELTIADTPLPVDSAPAEPAPPEESTVALEEPDDEPTLDEGIDDGVTHSVDWDDDPASYAGPV